MNEEDEIWTIELNLNDDFSDFCAYHIDTFTNTRRRHVSAALGGRKLDPWCLVGLANGHRDAHAKCKEMHDLLCEMSGRKHKVKDFE